MYVHLHVSVFVYNVPALLYAYIIETVEKGYEESEKDWSAKVRVLIEVNSRNCY